MYSFIAPHLAHWLTCWSQNEDPRATDVPKHDNRPDWAGCLYKFFGVLYVRQIQIK